MAIADCELDRSNSQQGYCICGVSNSGVNLQGAFSKFSFFNTQPFLPTVVQAVAVICSSSTFSGVAVDESVDTIPDLAITSGFSNQPLASGLNFGQFL